jgi:hypothetical protein
MADYSTALDSAPPPQRNGKIAGFVTWHALPSQDGINQPGSFSLRNRDEKRVLDLAAGFIADWPNSRTGWEEGSPYDPDAKRTGPPNRIWNPTRNQIAPRPGPEWKRVIELIIAVNDERFLWTQATFGAWEALVAILRAVADAKGETKIPNLPLLNHLGAVPALNGSSLVPTFTLVRFVPPPACFNNLPDEPSNNRAVAARAAARDSLNDDIPF